MGIKNINSLFKNVIILKPGNKLIQIFKNVSKNKLYSMPPPMILNRNDSGIYLVLNININILFQEKEKLFYMMTEMEIIYVVLKRTKLTTVVLRK